ncbi:HD-GYP domain-containing protein [Candidatus Symbiobacter mobilis]|uniref:Response regulator n=1 Tax=Candidatus Symbiobacter mobilis CR TaxID=946483 RepID=U5N7W4_9BURK|nr:HD-GYP domain-containing protein [Candidatus Symbiobacter mobilis]AGX87385.1 response regulator [Candidatus Symbiobacter mobilis CR]
MNPLHRRIALRIATVSVLLACVTSPLAWFLSRGMAEDTVVAIAIEESEKLLGPLDAMYLTGPDAASHAHAAAQSLAGGIFDIVEMYDGQGNKLAESVTDIGKKVEAAMAHHDRPDYRKPGYESHDLPGTGWVLRVFVPLQHPADNEGGSVIGYLEGVRVVPPWQRQQMLGQSLGAAVLVCVASLLCGAVLYPVVVRLSRENERKTHEVLDSHILMMEALGRTVAQRDSDTGAHNYRVAWMAAMIAEAMGLSGTSMQALIAGSFLHDVGKVGIPDAILRKPARLLDSEMEIMRTHVNLGKDIVVGAGWLDGAHDVVAAHHEKWDGSGYPAGLRGEDIPLAARIFAVADVFDALCSQRPYKAAMGFDEAMAILERDTGTHFDPTVMAVFRPLARNFHDQLSTCGEDGTRALLAECMRRHFRQ